MIGDTREKFRFRLGVDNQHDDMSDLACVPSRTSTATSHPSIDFKVCILSSQQLLVTIKYSIEHRHADSWSFLLKPTNVVENTSQNARLSHVRPPQWSASEIAAFGLCIDCFPI